MILLNTKKINRKEEKIEEIEEKIQKYEEEINYKGFNCRCGNREFNMHGEYERNVIKDGKEYKIKIKRFKCTRCGKTHGILPDFLFPYYQTEAEEIIECVEEMIEKEKSTTEIEKERNISRQKLNQWRKKYRKMERIIRETYGHLLKINEFLSAEKRNKVCHQYKDQYLIAMTT